jgi:hypothetical protein
LSAITATFCLSIPCGNCEDWRTDYEKSGYTETPRLDQTVEYCERLAEASPWVHYTTFGVSPQGRDLPLVIVDRKKRFTPKEVRKSDNAVLLIQAGIHPGEIDGKDAGLMLLRDIAITKEYEDLLDHATILFIPIFNVDGHERFGPNNRINQNGPEEMGWRTTAQNLNLNRDFMKADAPEMEAWLRLFVEWLPDFLVDCHTTDGADYQYVVTYALEIFGSMDPGLTEWARDVYLEDMEIRMEKSGFPIMRYVSFSDWLDPMSGIISWSASPRLSDGYGAVQNRVCLLVETHMLKTYRERVEGTYEMLRHTASIVNDQHRELTRLNREADWRAADPVFRQQPFGLQFNANSDTTMIDFLSYEYEVYESDLTGGQWYRYSDVPKTLQIPYFNHQDATVTVMLPEAYVIPPEWDDVIRRVQLHGVDIQRLSETAEIRVRTYKFHDVNWRDEPYEGRHPLDFEVEDIERVRTFPAGSVLVDMNQRAARAIAHMLEPQGRDSFLRWGFFDAVFEQKEYTEMYVMEKMAREMLAEDPALAEEFHQKMESDSTFAGHPWQILNWFYQRTPWWDERKDVYPVGRIFDRGTVKRLKTKE